MNDCALFVFAAATNRPAGCCINCGVLQMNSGLCSRCIDMGQCIVCKRYLPPPSFEEVNVRICQVYRHFCVNSFNQHSFSLSHCHAKSVYLSDHWLLSVCFAGVFQKTKITAHNACSRYHRRSTVTDDNYRYDLWQVHSTQYGTNITDRQWTSPATRVCYMTFLSNEFSEFCLVVYAFMHCDEVAYAFMHCDEV